MPIAKQVRRFRVGCRRVTLLVQLSPTPNERRVHVQPGPYDVSIAIPIPKKS
jgi:hypothetical protein